MEGVLNSIASTYNYVLDDLADPRTKHLPLMSSPIPVIVTVALYLKFCTDYGPRFMKNRRPFELKLPIMLYNIFQILLSVFLVYEGLNYLLMEDYSFGCDPFINSDDTRVTRTAVCSWFYFFGKLTELLDTVFFVFRKKSRQISTLHLYHHSMVAISSWGATKYFPVGPFILIGTLNSFVHILMYTYYFIAGLGPQYQKYLWWKKYVTLIQLTQFLVVITHNTNALFHDCNYPKHVHIFCIVNTSLLFYMFSNFYYNTYIKVNPKKIEDVTTKVKSASRRKEKRVSVGQ
ncbi:hypothetical protein PYW08_015027 [Mythimna loreyi]|uniref:Uncharacterized protein n=1 Tax=Mythimna loreyi TaxID=667449 RepID=A0ACC2R430_9NEOP|nr:hypothetical protein PYW08_015027 [Mythimna loreyi]